MHVGIEWRCQSLLCFSWRSTARNISFLTVNMSRWVWSLRQSSRVSKYKAFLKHQDVEEKWRLFCSVFSLSMAESPSVCLPLLLLRQESSYRCLDTADCWHLVLLGFNFVIRYRSRNLEYTFRFIMSQHRYILIFVHVHIMK